MKLLPIGDQVIVITGASSGIGLTTARMAARAGARVVMTARDEETLRAEAQRIEEAAARLPGSPARADPEVCERVARHAMLTTVAHRYLGQHAASVFWPHAGGCARGHAARVRRHVLGLVHGILAAVPRCASTAAR